MRLDESNPTPVGADETAGGHERSLQTLADVRRRALSSVMQLNAQHESFNSPILPVSSHGGTSPHSHANSQVLAYHTLLSKPGRFNKTKAWEFYRDAFTTVPVPVGLDEDDGIPEVEVDKMADSVDKYLDRMELEAVPLSLETVDEWKNRTVNIKKVPSSPYEKYREPEVVSRSMALPPATLDELFRRLDSLADHYGVLINIKDTDKDPYKI